jgi:hypothetical protein
MVFTVINSILLLGIIIFVAIIFIFEYEDSLNPPLVEGLKLKDLTRNVSKMSNKVNDGFKKVGKEFKKIGDVLKCPISIFSNIPLCGLYYLEDLVVLLIWFLLWLLCYFFIYLPIVVIMKMYNAAGGKYFCKSIRHQDVCPTKQFIGEIMELCFQFFGFKILLRSSKDVKKCYCIPPLKMAFQPLTNMKYSNKLKKMANSNDEKSHSERIFISMLVIGVVFAINLYGYKK